MGYFKYLHEFRFSYSPCSLFIKYIFKSKFIYMFGFLEIGMVDFTASGMILKLTANIKWMQQ